MSKWIAKLFETKHNPNDIVAFIRTEYANDVRHMRDEDVIHFYNNINILVTYFYNQHLKKSQTLY